MCNILELSGFLCVKGDSLSFPVLEGQKELLGGGLLGEYQYPG